MIRYRCFDHTADLGVQVFGATKAELFVNGAYALFDLLTEMEKVRCVVMREIRATGRNLNDLWVNYLREVLYLSQGEGLLCRDYAIVAIDEERVTARLQGEVFDPSRHRIKREVKAVTYHQAAVLKTTQGWTGRMVLDV